MRLRWSRRRGRAATIIAAMVLSVAGATVLVRRGHVGGLAASDSPWDWVERVSWLAGLMALIVAVLSARLGRLTEARQLHTRTLADFERVLGRDHPDTIRSAEHLVRTLRKLGRRRAARRLEAEIAARRDGSGPPA